MFKIKQSMLVIKQSMLDINQTMLEISVRPIPFNRPINRSNFGRLIDRLLSADHRSNRRDLWGKIEQKCSIFTQTFYQRILNNLLFLPNA